MTECEFLGIADAAKTLGMGVRKAKAFLLDNGLKPVNTSKGKRGTFQWSRKAILALIDTLQSESSAPSGKVVRRKASAPNITRMTSREVFAWIHKGNSNGNQETQRTQ